MPFRITNRSMSKRSCILLLLVPVLACSGSETETLSPAAPSPAAPTTRTTFTMSGQVIASQTRVPISEATVSVIYGSDVGRSATTDTSGNFSFTGMQQSSLMVWVSAAEYFSRSAILEKQATTIVLVPLGPVIQLSGQVTDDGTSAPIAAATVTSTPDTAPRPMLPENTASRVVSISATGVSHSRLPTGTNLILDTFEGIRRRIFAYVASSEFSGGSHGL